MKVSSRLPEVGVLKMMIHADVKSTCDTWSIYRGLGILEPAVLKNIGAQRMLLFAELAWEATGEQIFMAGYDQARMFREMDLSSVTTEDIQFPFESFYVVLENSNMKMRASVFGDQTESERKRSNPEHTVQGMYVFRKKRIDKGERVREGVMLHTAEIAVESEATMIVVWAQNNGAPVWDDIVFCLSVTDKEVAEHGNYEAAIINLLSSDDRAHDSHTTEEEAKFNRQTALECCRIAFGMCAYLECRQAVVVEKDYSAERKKLQRKIDNGGKKAAKAERMIVKIPSTVVRIIDPNLRYLAEDGVSVKSHWRRAHTRLQWLGSKKHDDGSARLGEKRERRWIHATIVNADTEQQTKKKAYIVE